MERHPKNKDLGFEMGFLGIPNLKSSSRGLGIYSNLGIFIPGIGDLFKPRDFFPGIGDFLKSGDFYRRGLGIFIPGIGIF